MKPNRGSDTWFKGAIILTVAALITKVLSAIYRIPFQNIVGDIGFYIYQQVYPFYGLALVFSTYGFPIIISKYVTELQQKRQSQQILRFLLLSYFILSVLGFLFFLLLFYGAPVLAEMMDDPGLTLLLKVISIVFLLFPIISIIRGYFQGIGYMVPTAISQVSEQMVRVVTILVIAIMLTGQGYSLYIVGGGAAFGSITGGLIASLLLVFYFIKEMNNHFSFSVKTFKHLYLDLKVVFKILIIQGLAICLSGMLLILVQMADSLNLVSLLLQDGINLSTAQTIKGIYDRGQPLIQLGSIVATSMSLALVPIISSMRMKDDQDRLSEKIRFSLQISIVFGAAATVGLLAIIEPTNEMLFTNREGSTILAWLTPVILLSTITLTVISILQGLEVLFFPAWVVLLTFVLKYSINTILVPFYGATGAAIATNISLCIGIGLLYWKLKKLVPQRLIQFHFLGKVGAATIVMYALLKLYLYATDFFYLLFESHRLYASLQSIGGVLLGGIVFLIIIMRMNILPKEDLALIPFGSKLLYFIPKK